MKIRAVILDFDGTLVTHDIMDILCDLAGKKQASEELNRLFHDGKTTGLGGLVERINLLQGVTLEQIRQVVEHQDYLRQSTYELFDYLKANKIVSIIASGNITPLLEIYKEKLGADYIVGSKPVVEDGTIVSISEKNYSGSDFKVRDSAAILKRLNIPHASVAAIGDSPGDKGIFELSNVSIAIDPKGGVDKIADFVIYDDIASAIPIINQQERM